MPTPRHAVHRPPGPREPVDPARIGWRVVRRRATGMTADAVAAALDDARFFARQDSRHEDLADDPRGRAELAEWERIDQLLAAASPSAVYDPQSDDVARAEPDAAAAAAREAELREAARIEARADELQALRELGTLAQAKPQQGDEAVRDLLTRRAGHYVQADVDAWFAHALATGRGHYADPAARPPPTSCRARSPPTPHCWPPSPASSSAATSTSWRSPAALRTPTRKPPPTSPRSSPAEGTGVTLTDSERDTRCGTRAARCTSPCIHVLWL
jgi:hypothetical protein